MSKSNKCRRTTRSRALAKRLAAYGVGVLLAMALSHGIGANAFGEVVTELTTGTNGSSFYPGQSVTTPNNGTSYDNLKFNWYEYYTNAPHASGTIILLSQAYTGTRSGLSGATAGFIASAAAVGNEFVFASSVTLQPNVQYFFYQDEGKTDNYLRYKSLSTYLGGDRYSAGIPDPLNPYFLNSGTDWNFTLSGAAVVPEPSAIVLLGIALAAGMAYRHLRRAAKQ